MIRFNGKVDTKRLPKTNALIIFLFNNYSVRVEIPSRIRFDYNH